MYQYRATLHRVVDGDTVDVCVDLGFHLVQTMRLRLNGVNTPEVRGPEREEGLRATAFVEETLGAAKVIGLKTHKLGKFGRFISDVYYSNEDIPAPDVFEQGIQLNQQLLDEGYAEPYPK